MDSNKLEAALRRLEDEQFGRTFNMPGIDPAVVGAWFRWLRDIKQEQPEPVRIADTVPDGGKITPQVRAAMTRMASPSPSKNNNDVPTAADKEINVSVEHEPEKQPGPKT